MFGYAIVELQGVAAYSKDRVEREELTINNYVSVENLLQDRAGKVSAEKLPVGEVFIGFNNEDILIGNIRPYLKKIWFSDCKGGTNGDVLVVKNKNSDVLSSKYLYHVLASDNFFHYNNSNSKGTKMPRGDKEAIMRYKFILPSPEKQEWVYQYLNVFHEISYNLCIGLPAEINARQKQYEYYRNRLLSFDEK